MAFKTKPRGIHATFAFDCPRCRGEATVTNGRPDKHDCEPARPLPYIDELERINWPPPMAG